MNISLDRYKTFLTVAQCASISKASARLNISQPAVSQSIRQLEEQLACPLFVRSPRGVTLTPEGEALLPFVTQAMALLAHAQQHFDDLRALEVGSLRIGASDTLCKYWLLSHLADFHRRHPAVSIQVTNRTSSETLTLLGQGKVDIGLVNLPLEIPPEYLAKKIAPVQDCFLYNPSVFGPLPDTLPPAALAEYPLILLEKASASRRYLDAFFLRHGQMLSPEIELGSLDLLIEFAKAGLGICAAVAQYAAAELEDGALRRLDLSPGIPQRYTAIVYHKDLPLPYCAQAFLSATLPT